MPEEILNSLIPIITSSSLLIGAVALWVFYKGFRPIFIDLYKAFDSIFAQEDKKNIMGQFGLWNKKYGSSWK